AGVLRVEKAGSELLSDRLGGCLWYDYDEFLFFSIRFDLSDACEPATDDLCIGLEPRFAFIATRVDWNLAVEKQRSVSYRFLCPSEHRRKSAVRVVSFSFFLRNALEVAVLDEVIPPP